MSTKYSSNSGVSIKDAIAITGTTHHLEGIQAEYNYIERKYGIRWKDWHLVNRRFFADSNRKYDHFVIRLTNGRTVEIYFDITDFYGKGVLDLLMNHLQSQAEKDI